MGAADIDNALDLAYLADSRDLRLAVPRSRPTVGTALTVGWVCTPPGPGSGGHTTGVVFCARRGTARRGLLLRLLALLEFHRLRPEHPIYLFGDSAVRPATNHGVLPMRGLADRYNTCAAGLALSFTNLSLVPDEMLARGVVPVVGESALSAASMGNPFLLWAPPTPMGLANALVEAVDFESRRPRSRPACGKRRGPSRNG